MARNVMKAAKYMRTYHLGAFSWSRHSVYHDVCQVLDFQFGSLVRNEISQNTLELHAAVSQQAMTTV